jgi:hypothetical protein
MYLVRLMFARTGVLTLFFLLGLLVAGCSSTTPQASSDGTADTKAFQGEQVVSWLNPDVEPQRYEKMLVIFYEEDVALRREAEAYFATNMAQHGVEVIASSALEPDIDALEDTAAVIAMAAAQGAEALITVEFKEFKKGYRPNSDGYAAAWVAAALIDDSLRRAVWATSVADRVASSLASMEVRLWDLGTETKVWAGTTNVQTYDSVKSDTKRFSRMVAKDLATKKLI